MIVRLIVHGLLIGLGVVGGMLSEGIEGSAHDFSRYGWSEEQLCLPCHTPHGAAAPTAAAPLWDHSPSATKRFKLFDGRPGMPGAGSLVCLSCHDGSTAVDAFGGSTGERSIRQFAGGRAHIGGGGDLSTDHPIGVAYPEHDRSYRPRNQVEADGAVALPSGRVECISCHDVHNQFGHDKLLVKSNKRSALCLTCHRK